jgi:hypothetical protein
VFANALKQQPQQLTRQLVQLADQAQPVPTTASSSSSSSSGDGLTGVLQLPPDALARAQALLHASELKLTTFDQVG